MNKQLSNEELTEIESRASAATEGPWGISTCYGVATIIAGEDGKDSIAHAVEYLKNGDAEFIAASRADIPRLIAEVKRLHLENNIMRTAIGEAVDHIKEADEFDVTIDGEYLLQLLAKVGGSKEE
jgi:hypothetical protein